MPRKPRSEVNRRPEMGVFNCSWGMFSKANGLFRRYGVDVVVIARRPDGGIAGYQSCPGLAKDFLQIDEQDLLRPPDVDPYMAKASKGVARLRAMSSSRASSSFSEIAGDESLDQRAKTTSPELEALPLSLVNTHQLEEGVMEEPIHPWAEAKSDPTAQRLAAPQCVSPTSLTKQAPETDYEAKENIHQPAPRSRITKKEILSLIEKFA